MVITVIILLALADLGFYVWADRRLSRVPGATLWRGLLFAVLGTQFVLLLWWVLFPRTLSRLGGWFWTPMTMWLYLWHLLILPVTVVLLLLGHLVWGAGRLAWRQTDRRQDGTHDGAVAPAPAPASAHHLQPGPAAARPIREATILEDPADPLPAPSRRRFLGAAVALAPQAALAYSLVVANEQAGHFRVRRMTLPLRQLPKALDGMTVTHLSDTHAGRFIREREFENILQVTADLSPDLILFTGDLIDFNLMDLPMAQTAMRRIERIAPLALCVGNHDLFENGPAFRQRVRTAELALLVNEVQTVEVRGQKIDLLGLDWGTSQSQRVADIDGHMRRLLSRHAGPSDRFSILLAHHPHAFDQAAAAGIPLTLSGHTHGGQIMLTEQVGLGRVFKYWSGLYEKGDQKLVVSNGVGNWFPIRVNAPAEIVHLTLTCG